MTKRLELIAVEGFPPVEPGDSLPHLILDTLQQEQIILLQGDALVPAQKIFSKSENRYLELADVEASAEAEALALRCDKDARLVQLGDE